MIGADWGKAASSHLLAQVVIAHGPAQSRGEIAEMWGCAMFDLIVSGGTAVLPTGAEAADIAISGGKIVAIGAPGSLAAIGAGRTVDAGGQIVMPGAIDPHVHCG